MSSPSDSEIRPSLETPRDKLVNDARAVLSAVIDDPNLTFGTWTVSRLEGMPAVKFERGDEEERESITITQLTGTLNIHTTQNKPTPAGTEYYSLVSNFHADTRPDSHASTLRLIDKYLSGYNKNPEQPLPVDDPITVHNSKFLSVMEEQGNEPPESRAQRILSRFGLGKIFARS